MTALADAQKRRRIWPSGLRTAKMMKLWTRILTGGICSSFRRCPVGDWEPLFFAHLRARDYLSLHTYYTNPREYPSFWPAGEDGPLHQRSGRDMRGGKKAKNSAKDIRLSSTMEFWYLFRKDCDAPPKGSPTPPLKKKSMTLPMRCWWAVCSHLINNADTVKIACLRSLSTPSRLHDTTAGRHRRRQIYYRSCTRRNMAGPR